MFRRLCIALLLIAAVGLPTQAAQGSAAVAQTALAAGMDLAMPEGCDGAGAPEDGACPVAVCLAPAALVGDTPWIAPAPREAFPSAEHGPRRGLSPGPDPSPPRPVARG